jgi:translation initiation factor IF-2
MDNIVIGSTFGRVKTMKEHTGKNLRLAGPSTPILIAGLSATPQSGDIFQVVETEKSARGKAQNVHILQEADLLMKRGVGEIMSQISSGQMKQLKLVLKADTKGSLEAIKQSLAEIKNEDVGVKVILSGVGNVTESDVMMAAAAGGIVIGFNVKLHTNVKEVAEREHTEIMQYNIIYKLIDDVRKILTGLLEPENIEVVVGRAEVRQVFLTKKKEMIVGCKIVDGKMQKVKVRIIRKDEIVGEGRVDSLRKVDKNVPEVSEGNDCGILYSGYLPLFEGDILEGYKTEKRVKTL